VGRAISAGLVAGSLALALQTKMRMRDRNSTTVAH